PPARHDRDEHPDRGHRAQDGDDPSEPARVTSTTPHAASTTSASVVASGIWPAPDPAAGATAPALPPPNVAQSLVPATATSTAPPAPSARVGPRDPRRRSAIRGQQQVGVEAGAVAGVAGHSLLVDLDEQGVAVAVEPDLLDPLAVPGGLALDPVL